MFEKEKKKQVAKIATFITSIFVIFLSISYAFINQTLTGTKRQVIRAGSLELKLTEGNGVILENAMPMADEVGLIQEPFTFSLENVTTTPTNYVLRLVDITPDGIQKLDTSVVKYGLEKDGIGTKDLLSNLTDNVIDSGTLIGNGTISYNLRLWIASHVEDEKEIKNKALSYKLEIEASQEIEISYKGMMKAREFEQWDWHSYDLTYNDYYQYNDNITNIVIENKINVPDTIEEDKKWDMSKLQDDSVIAYLEEDGTLESGEIAYKLHIQGKGGVIANEDCAALFYGFPELLSITGFEYLDVSSVKLFRISDLGSNDAYSIFGNCPKLSLDLSKLDTSNVTNMNSMFSGYSSNSSLDLSNFNTSKVTDMSSMFEGCGNLTSLDLSSFNTSNVTDMTHMFSGCSNLTSLDLNSFNTSNVTDMSWMFMRCSNLTSLDLSSFNTSNVTNMTGMFRVYSGSLVLDLSSFDTSNVTSMEYMFDSYSSSQPLDLSNFDTSNVTNMNSMFSNYSSSQPLNLSSFDTSNVTSMEYMFDSYSSSQPLNLSSFDTSNVTSMDSMFSNYSSSQSLDLSSFDTANVTNMSWMFSNYSSSSALDLSQFDTSNVENMSRMFIGYSSTAPLDISSFDFSKVIDSYYIFNRSDEYNTVPILVKDEAMKTWVLSKNSHLTGVTIKDS